MVRFPPIFTRETDEEKTQLLDTTPLSSTPYPFKAQSTYIPPETDAPKPVEESIPDRRPGFWGQVALRFSGFTANLKAAVEPLNSVRRPELARNFFANRFVEAYELSAKNPESAHRIIEKNTRSASPLWRNLLLVGCGDGSALAPALAAIEGAHSSEELVLAECAALVARVRPR